ncbi:HlyD family secretion protein [Pseudonocardia hierapolitana]|uniref:HlyD family secretion protein n=1 Tax=Pseudonocardia hierapolitana TaxID=1128676 RepID=A0A561T076_9PSEU|nr:efflux RND transporter periplasmic adaptor subunit [Pseudonocardia hierapolitana]TWF80504.1 HlyD family secretion protein [Pseudonocardia hierapolitana]
MTEGPDTEPIATSEGASPSPAGRRRMRRTTRIGLLVVLVLAVVLGGGATAWFVIDAQSYVTTDNAQVDGDEISVNAPTSGYVVDWTAGEGARLTADHVVGRIRMQGAFVQPEIPVRAPADSTVVIDNAVEDAFVTAGTQLAVAYDFSTIYVTARVDETDIDDVRVGQRVDIEVDAFPGGNLTGRVREVQGGAAGVFSVLPESNTSGNFQKVTQVIPVEIALDDPRGLALVPGMSVTVKIHKG